MEVAGSTTDLPRHSFIDVDPRAWPTELAAHDPTLAEENVVRDWVGLGRPLIARRRLDGDPPDRVPVGLPLPPGMGKRRLALTLPPAAVLAVRPPPALASVSAIAPVAWRPTIVGLLALAAPRALVPRVFGSFAWQASTGLDYVAETSDLDLIWPIDEGLPAVLHAIAALESTAPGGLDGEIAGPLGAVHWRELSSGARDVLVKTSTSVALIARDAFVASYR